MLTCVDYRQRLALVAEVETADGAEPVGLRSFAANDDRCVESRSSSATPDSIRAPASRSRPE